MDRAFGVLQSRFAIVHGQTSAWHVNTLKNIMYACITLYNMIVEDERHNYNENFDYDSVDIEISMIKVFNSAHPTIVAQYMQRRVDLRDKEKHHQLKNYLIEHTWEQF